MDYRTPEQIRRDDEQYERQHPGARALFVIQLVFCSTPVCIAGAFFSEHLPWWIGGPLLMLYALLMGMAMFSGLGKSINGS